MIPVAELMIQEGMSFSNACQALGVKFDSAAEERAAEHIEVFQNIVDALEFKFYSRIGNNPLLCKEFAAGTLVWAARRLREQDAPSDVVRPVAELSKLMGWYPEGDTEKPVLANLTQSEIDALKAKIAEAKKAQEPTVIVVEPPKEPS
jgi:hypothetical protein